MHCQHFALPALQLAAFFTGFLPPLAFAFAAPFFPAEEGATDLADGGALIDLQ